MSTGPASYRGVRALVFGGGGFIGRWTAAALHAHGAQLAVATRDARGAVRVLREHGVVAELHVVDLARGGDAAKLVRTLRPQIVFNLAGYGVDRGERDEGLALRLNAELVGELAEALQPDPAWGGQALVHAGSALEFGTTAGDLSDPWRCAPTTLYGRTKLAGSARLREVADRRELRALSARLFTVYGPGEHAGRLLPSLLEAAQGGADLPLTGGLQQRDFTYVEDVAEGLLRLGESTDACAPRALNLATGRLASVREFVESAAHSLGMARERLQFGQLPTRPEEMAHGPVSTTALEGLAGWRPSTSIEAGVRRTLAFERRAGRR